MSGITPPKAPQPASTPAAPRDAVPTARVDRTADADRFARLLRGEEDPVDETAMPDGERGGGSGGEDDTGGEENPSSNPGDAILAALLGPAQSAARGVEGPGSADAAQPATGVAELAELTDKIVERVLVGKREDGETEMRLTLRSEIFGETEVSIARHQGALELRIETMSDKMKDLLRDNGADLTRGLASRLGERVVVEVNAAGAGDQTSRQGDGDNRRSRGYEQILRYAAEKDS